MIRIFSFCLLIAFFIQNAAAQKIRDSLATLGNALSNGDITALSKLTEYLEDTTSFTEFWAHGSYEITVAQKAGNIINRYSLFLPKEFDWNDSTADLKSFLQKQWSSIKYDTATEKFLITPLSSRTTSYKLYEFNPAEHFNQGLLLDSLGNRGFDALDVKALLAQKNSKVLFRIASIFYTSNGYDHPLFEQLFASLTNVLVSITDQQGNWRWNYERDYDGFSRLQLLIYWANHFGDYRWNSTAGKFLNVKERLEKTPRGIQLLHAMQSETDSVAMNAFITMAQSHPDSIKELPVEDFEEGMNYFLPTFKGRFIQVLSRYHLYCKENKISLILNARTRNWFNQLTREDLLFKERYQLENEIIVKATPDEISALEYWFLVNEQHWDLIYSAGRIVDKFYSFHWKQIAHNENQLRHYLKKAALFDRLGIIGNCNKYLRKFQHIDDLTGRHLPDIISSSKDPDIVQNAKMVLPGMKPGYSPITDKINNANYDTTIADLEKQLPVFLNKPHENYEHPLYDLISIIDYSQIAEFMSLVRQYKAYEEVYDFIERDFGFPVPLDDSNKVQKFLQLHRQLSYKDLCLYYLDELGLHYKKADGSLDYQSIYEILEFDIVDALAGGGGGRREEGVYLVIKLLEFEFHTTLGFPQKLCNSGGIYGCSADERAREWIGYLKEKQLVKPFEMPLSVSNLNN